MHKKTNEFIDELIQLSKGILSPEHLLSQSGKH